MPSRCSRPRRRADVATRSRHGELLRAHGGPAGQAYIRDRPEHFAVEEELGFEPDGEGGHVLLRVRKRGANTHWVARRLAELAGVPVRDVGFAGLKDRHAVTIQTFSVPVPGRELPGWRGHAGDGFEVLSVARHRRKLRRGSHRGNRFRIVLAGFEGDRDRARAVLALLASAGAPNHFGPQRFGRGGANLETATRWFATGAAPTDRLQRAFALSAARAAVFNAVLAARLERGSWNRLEAGDIANLDGTGSIFAVPVVDAALEERCARLDVHPTGPLWGRGAMPSALERDVAHALGPLADGLAANGLESERRALRVRVAGLTGEFDAGDLVLDFRLPRGAFATAVLNEIADVHGVDTDEEE
jgi:tRNA pseudouridine13 synthase